MEDTIPRADGRLDRRRRGRTGRPQHRHRSLNTIRGRLALSSVLIFSLVSLTSFFLVYGTRLNDGYLSREQVVEERLDALEHLSVEIYQYVTTLGDWLLLPGAPDSNLSVGTRFDVIEVDLERLERAYSPPSRQIQPPAPGALERNEQVRAILDDGRHIFESFRGVEGWQAARQAWLDARRQLQVKIDDELVPLIETGVNYEREALSLLRARYHDRALLLLSLSTLIGIAVAVTTVVILAMLYRNIRDPLERLSERTRAIVAGRFHDRVDIDGPIEYAALAHSFDEMASRLAEQREALVAARNSLEDEVARQTRELQTKNEKLEELDNSRKRLLLDVGHELRTPLTVIQGEVETALRVRNPDHDDLVATLGRVAEATAGVNRLVNDLFLVARADFDPTSPIFEPVDYAAILAELCDTVTVLAARKSIEVRFELPSVPLPGRADRDRIKQALTAILDNAVRYSNDGGRVTVTTTASAGQLGIEIADEGIGIERADAERAFERFYRAVAAREHSPNGSGLGLAVAHAIITLHGGSVALGANPGGRGTVARVAIPLDAAAATGAGDS